MPANILSGLASLPADQLWLAGAVTSFAILAALGLRNPHLVRVGLRNVPRRWGRTALIVFGLMFSTMFVASSLMVDDTITLAVKSVAVFNLGRIDEDVVGYSDGLDLFSSSYGPVVKNALDGDAHVAGVAPSLSMQNLFLADTVTRQVRSSVTGLGMDPNEAGPLGQLRSQTGAAAPVQALASDEIYLNRNAGALLFAHPGDTIWLSSTQWQGRRYTFHVRAIVTGGPLGDAPEVVLPLPVLQQMANAPDQINHIYIANAGNGLTGVGYSDEIADRVRGAVFGDLHVDQVKLDGVNFSLKAQDIFSRILTLYTSFALSIGLLLIFLIFVLLAAERRTELGMTRAIGMRQSHVVFMLLFEGAAYDAFAAALGIIAGLSLAAIIVAVVSPTVARIGFPLSIALRPESMVIAFSLGFLFTLSAIWFAAWSVSHMTVAAALRDLPEPPAAPPSLLQYAQACLVAVVKGPLALLAGVGRLIGALVTRGPIPLIAGLWIFQQALASQDILWLSLGFSSIITGMALLARSAVLAVAGYSVQHTDPDGLLISRAYVIADRLTSLVVGASL
ncbi:MAG TPA: ABC transporter permease, partial [Ktedonobacterales bacterium]|nr:ABC transporter permease [Ktedonobacterales bacterium]